MNGKVQFGIGFVSGRTNVCDIINKTYNQLINQIKKCENEIEITIFILFDLLYQVDSKKEDFYKISNKTYEKIKIKYITPEDIENYKQELVESGILNAQEADLFFGYGYAKARNTLLYNALKHGMDYFLFWDDDEYPVACIQKDKKLEWKLQDNILVHLKYIENADITFGQRCGYNSPIPYINLNKKIDEKALKAYVEAVKNEFTSWEKVKTSLIENDGITYADEKIANGQEVAYEMGTDGTYKWISGSPLCLNLRHIEKIPAFYNPEGARGEDAFFSLLLKDVKTMSVPVYHFHDAFLKYTKILQGKYPRKLGKIEAKDKITVKRFFNASRGWIKYRPLFLYITNNENYREEIENTKSNLRIGIPEINRMFPKENFYVLLSDLEEYDRNVEKDYADFLNTQKIWDKLKLFLKVNNVKPNIEKEKM